jgi:hypothetical protein
VPIIAGPENAILDMSVPLSRVLICDGLFHGAIDLHELGVELSDLLLSPDGRTEAVMADRGHHEERGVARVASFVQPVRPLRVLTSPSDDGIRDYLLSMSGAQRRRRWQRPAAHWMAAIPDPC